MGSLSEHLDLIRRNALEVCARHGVLAEDAEDFCQDAALHVQQNDVLGKYAGGNFQAYLRRVVQNLYFDKMNRERGRWRPSAYAKKLGSVAVQLDTLINRDGYTRDEALEMLVLRDDVQMAREEIAALGRLVPQRDGRPTPSLAPVDDQPGGDPADGRVNQQERTRAAERAHAILRRALATLPSEDQVLVLLRYKEGFKVSEIARNLQLDQKSLYGRIKAIRVQLRGELRNRGLDRDDIVWLFDES